MQLTRRITLAASILILLTTTVYAANAYTSSTAQPGSDPRQNSGDLVTFFTSHGAFLPLTLDPQRATDRLSSHYQENLYLGLTDVHPETLEIVPELATNWTFDPTTNTWTFNLRSDVPWIQWNPETDEAVEQRAVTAADFVTGIRRACSPENATVYNDIFAALIAGCQQVYNMAPEDVSDTDFEAVQAIAVNNTTLQITLRGPIGYFLPLTALWSLRPVPAEALDTYSESWTEPGNLWTNGPFVLDEWQSNTRRVLLRNPLYPEALRGPGNVDRVIDREAPDHNSQYALYQNNQLDLAAVPGSELQNALSDPDTSEQVVLVPSGGMFYFGFAVDKAPFDNVHVRRAFSAAFNRAAFVQEALEGRGIPMMHWVPPGSFGAPPIDEIGIDGDSLGLDIEYAREELAEAGYPNCAGFPQVTVASTATTTPWITFLQTELQNRLDCNPDIFRLEQVDLSTLFEITHRDAPPETRPALWAFGWYPSYPDANSWLVDAGLYCDSSNPFARPCNDRIDPLIIEAQLEIDLIRRAQLYRQVEEAFFGYEGAFPLMPLYLSGEFVQAKPWVTAPLTTDGLWGGEHYDWITIDPAAPR